MGVDVADFDGDGRPDIWVTNFEREDNALYRNLGNSTFLHATAAVGMSGVSRMFVGFGTAMTDFDSDGWPDLFVLNGNPIYSAAESPFKQKPQLFRNLSGRFTDVSDHGGTFFREPHSGRGSAVADFDDDGALDIVAIPMNDPVRILRNRKGFFSQSDSRMIFPVAPELETADITVQWLARDREIFRGLGIRKTHVLIEGHGETMRD